MLFGKKSMLKKLVYTMGISLAISLLPQTTSFAATENTQKITDQIENKETEVLSITPRSGVNDGCRWSIDSKGKLTVRSESPYSNFSNKGWYEYKNDIVTLDIDVPYSSNLKEMFYGCDKLTGGKVKIDKGVGSAYRMFSCYVYADGYCYSNLKSIDLYCMNTSEVTDMSYMFSNCDCLFSLDLSGFDTSNVKDMSGMFSGCRNLRAVNLGSFKTQNVEDMDYMFADCQKLESLNLTGFNTSRLRDADSMFRNCRILKSVNLSGWDVRNLRSASGFFYNCSELEAINLSGWNPMQLEDTANMFQYCSSLKKLNLSGLNVSNVENMYGMFQGCSGLESLNLVGFNTANVEDMDYMFAGCNKLKKLDLSTFNTSKVFCMDYMFYSCSNLENIVFGKQFTMKNTTSASSMFSYCSKIKEIHTENFYAPKLRYCEGMFYNCSSLQNLNLKKFDGRSIISMSAMFFDCASLKVLDLSGFNLSHITKDYGYVQNTSPLVYCWSGCKLEKIITPKNLNKRFMISDDSVKWYRDDTKEEVGDLPKNMSKSITIHRQEKDNIFFDVRTSSWQYKPVEAVYTMKVMVGKSTTKDGLVVFDADAQMTRAEFVQTLYNYAGKPKPRKASPFKDATNQWYVNAVRWASEKGIVNGKSKTVFGANDKITRQDMVTILYNYSTKTNKKYTSDASKYNLNGFADQKNVANYAVLPMRWATGHKIMNGTTTAKGTKNLNPTGKATRAECAAVVSNYVTYIKSVK